MERSVQLGSPATLSATVKNGIASQPHTSFLGTCMPSSFNPNLGVCYLANSSIAQRAKASSQVPG